MAEQSIILQLSKTELKELIKESLSELKDLKSKEKIFTTNEVLSIFKITKTTLHNWVKTNRIAATKINRRVYFTQVAIQNVIESNQKQVH